MSEDWDDSDNEIALSANSALVMGTDGDAFYVAQPTSFEAQQNFITELENQMRSLGISTLFNQTYVGETAEANDGSLIAIQCCRRCSGLREGSAEPVDIAGAFVGREAPMVSVARDFDLQKLTAHRLLST